MALPDNFSSAEHLQDVALKLTNKRVKAYFRDVGDEDWEPNLDSDRARLRVACTHQEKDSLLETICRLQLFNIEIGSSLEDLAPVYGNPCTTFHDSVEFKPQILLKFFEKSTDAAARNRPRREAEVSFRLMDEKPETITRADVERYASRIKQLFGSPQPFSFKTGTTKFSYIDEERGYRFIISGDDEAEARKVIERTHEIRNHTPDWDRLTDSQSKANFTTNPGTVTILGQQYKKPIKRAVATVHFRRAELKLHGMKRDVLLVDSLNHARRTAVEFI